MNIELKNIKDNEWAITNEEGEMRFVKAQAESTEMADILNKEDELELLEETKEEVLENIDKINKSLKQDKGISIFALLFFLMTLGASIPIFIPFNGRIWEMILSLAVWLGGLTFVEGTIFRCHKHGKEDLSLCEERLQEIKEKEPELEKEIKKLKEKHNFKEETKEVIYLDNLRYENTEEKNLVRTRVRK